MLVLLAGVFVAAVLTSASTTSATSASEIAPPDPDGDEIVIDIYWGDGCPYCHDAIEELTAFADREEAVEVRTFEVWYDAGNRARMERVADDLDVRADAVPFIVVGNRSWTGYSGAIGRSIESTVLELRDGPGPRRRFPPPTNRPRR
jgi:thiol-disulfide isomerase/thioredoxin